MRRKLFASAVLLTVAEFGALALLLRIFLAGHMSELSAAAIALTPSFLVMIGPWTLFANRWTLGLRSDAPPERIREEIIQLPRRILFLRSLGTAAVALVLAPLAARQANLGAGAASVMAGCAMGIAFAFNNLRAWVYRRLLEPLAARVYEADPLLYEARTLWERLFVTANIPGIGGTFAAVLFCYFVVGADELREYLEFTAVFPLLVLVLAAGFGLDLYQQTRSVVGWASGKPGSSASRAIAVANALPYRAAASNLLAWAVAGLAIGVGHARRGALSAEVAEVVAGMVAVGCGVVLYQALWHRRILAGVYDAAAAQLRQQGGEVPRSRLSLQVKLLLGFLLLLGFGGIFAFSTTYAEHQRVLASSAAQRAGEELQVLLAKGPPELLATPGAVAPRQGSGAEVFVVRADSAWMQHDRHLPDAFLERVRASEAGWAGIPGANASGAWRRVLPEAWVGVAYPWRERDASPWGTAPLLYMFVLLLLATVGAMLLFVQELAEPIRALEREARRLGRGELDEPILTTESDEVGSLANALETSRKQLKQTLAEVRELNASLEERVRTRTAELEQTNLELANTLQALARAQEAMVSAEKLASLGRLSAGIAHEVNNPLNFVKNALPPLKGGLADLRAALTKGPLDPKATEATLAEVEDIARVMTNGVERMAQILRALLDFSRQAPEARPERFDLQEAVQQALALLRHDLRDRVEVKVDLGEVRTLVGQPGPLGQVLVNLVKNGAEAIEGRGTIEIRAQRTDGAVQLSVRDSGKGMSPEAQQRAFEPFFTTKPVGKGTGLGLAMVHGIVQKHGGRVELSSSPGEGTTVTLVLPQPPDAPG